MNPLDQKIRDYYAGQTMSPEKMRAILDAARFVRPRPRRAWLGLAASALVAAGLGGFALLRRAEEDPSARAAAEIARQHRLQRPLEVVSTTWDGVDAGLNRLAFTTKPTVPAKVSGLELLGGCMCHILGEDAAQLRVRDTRSGRICTLYVARLSPGLRRIRTGTHGADGVTMEAWEDAGRLYVLADAVA